MIALTTVAHPLIRRIAVSLLLLSSASCDAAPDRAVLVVAVGVVASVRAVQMAQAELEARPIPGLELRTLPASLRGSTPVERARWVSSVEDVVGVVGAGSSRGSLLAAPIYNESRVPQVVPTGTSSALATAGPWTFTQVPSDSVQGEVIADFVTTDLGARSVTIFYAVSGEYGIGLKDAVSRSMASRGVLIIDIIPVTPASDFDVLVSQTLLRGEPDVVVIAGRRPSVSGIVRGWEANGLVGAFVAGDGFAALSEAQAPQGPSALFKVDFWHSSLTDSMSQSFTRDFRDRFGISPTSNDVLTLDAVRLLMSAVAEVGSDRDAIRGYLSSVRDGRRSFDSVRGASGAKRLIMIDHAADSIVARWPR